MNREKSVFFLFSSFVLMSGLFSIQANATSYAVKAGGSGNYTTIQACASSAVAGDTCTVYAGTYSGWTQSASGNAGNPITFTANPGDSVTITSGVAISSRSYITIKGFKFNSGATITGNGSTQHCVISNNTMAGTHVFQINDGLGNGGSDNVFSFNTVNVGSTSSSSSAVYVYGDRNLFDGNEIYGGGGDCFNLGGTNVVIRNNYCHDLNGATSGEHIDFIQEMGGGTVPTLNFALVEGNIEQNCSNDGGNCHFIIVRTGGPAADTIVARYNFAQKLDGTGVSVGGIGDNVPNFHFYNNTIATERLDGENGACISFQNAANGVVINNICYNTMAGSWSPTVGLSLGNSDIAFTSSYSGKWNSPYSTESTYNTLSNRDPQFANYPTDASLQSSSPAKGTGVAPTTVASGDPGSGTSLVVADARFFQPGWAGAQGDWIRVGASATAQIRSINYSTNTLTLGSSISRSVGNPVYLYKDSSGNVVLSGSNPDIGGYRGEAVPPPQNLQGTVN